MPSIQERLDSIIAKQALLQHSFYQRWQQGQVSQQELRGYAKEYYPFEREFPRYLSAIHSRCENPFHRRALLENLIHEEQGEKNHRDLWLAFAEGLGVRAESVEEHFHSDETEHLLRTFRRFCQSDVMIDGLAALYAYERQQPEVARNKIAGLQQHYGVTAESALEFFRAHETYDVDHAQTEATLLEILCQEPKAQQRAEHVAAETCAALYEFLDGVERRYRTAV